MPSVRSCLRRASRASKTAPDSVLARAWPSVISATRAPKPSVLTLSPHEDACGPGRQCFQ